MTAARLLRYASFLSGFDYEIEYKRGINHQNVNCLSRAPIIQKFKSTDMRINEEIHHIHWSTIFEITTDILTPGVIARETERDEELLQIKN